MLIFTIREVDGAEYHDEISWMHEQCFAEREAPKVTEYETETGHWWLARFCEQGREHKRERKRKRTGDYAGFCGLKESASEYGELYLMRCGVLPLYRGNNLQLRMLQVRERWARKHYWRALRTDTTDNPPSANNLIRAGFHIFTPRVKWGFANTIYWRKVLS